MQIASLIFGILSLVGMLIAFIPCLGSLNWINIPFAIVGLVISAISYSNAPVGESKGSEMAGIIMCGIAIIFGMFRLVIGGGII